MSYPYRKILLLPFGGSVKKAFFGREDKAGGCIGVVVITRMTLIRLSLFKIPLIYYPLLLLLLLSSDAVSKDAVCNLVFSK